MIKDIISFSEGVDFILDYANSIKGVVTDIQVCDIIMKPHIMNMYATIQIQPVKSIEWMDVNLIV